MKKILFIILALLLNACVTPYPYGSSYGYRSVPYYGGTYYPRSYYGGYTVFSV